MTEFSLRNMSILITGGGSGIGLGAAKYFLELGAKVTICGRRESKIKAATVVYGHAEVFMDCAVGCGHAYFLSVNYLLTIFIINSLNHFC